MNFENVIESRKATRKFSDKKIEQEKLDKILNAGRIAPTAKNLQPFKIYIIQSEIGLNKLDKATRCRYGAQTVLLICGDKENAYTKKDYSTFEMDATIVTTHMMLEATNIGIDNIWIEMFDKKILMEEFEIPKNLIPVCLLPIGYRSKLCPPSPFHKVRKDITALVEYK